MAEQQKKKSDKAGGNRRRVQNYWSSHNQRRVAMRKLRATLRSSGPVQAFAWATARGVLGLLRKLENERVDGKFTLIAKAAKEALASETVAREVVVRIPTPYTNRGVGVIKKSKAKNRRGQADEED